MHRQLAFLVAEQAEDESASDDLMQLVRRVVENVGPKEVAARLHVSPSHLAHALSGREYRHMQAEWLPAIDALDPERRIARWFADFGGFDVKERTKRTPTEELAALREVLLRQGETGRRIFEEARVKP